MRQKLCFCCRKHFFQRGLNVNDTVERMGSQHHIMPADFGDINIFPALIDDADIGRIYFVVQPGDHLCRRFHYLDFFNLSGKRNGESAYASTDLQHR